MKTSAAIRACAAIGSRPSKSRTRSRLSWLTLAVGALLLGGCATPIDPRKDADLHQAAYTIDRPIVRPIRSLSSFSDSLMCMDHMLRAAQLPTTLITSKQFIDYSSKVPVGVKEMIITALSQMSRVSNAFRYVDYEVDIVRQDTVQNLTTILLNNNLIQLQRPALYVSGAVTFVDQNVTSANQNAGLSGERIDLGVARSRNATIMGLEMHLGDFRTRTLIPGIDSANEVVIGGGNRGLDLSGRIGTYGVAFNVGKDYALGAGGATRTLVDLGTIEVVGKWARVPYWQCLTLDQTHPDFQREMYEWYNESGGLAQTRLIQSSLIAQGYLPAGTELADMKSREARDALSRFQIDNGIVPTGTLDFRTYERALRHFVTLDSNGHLQQVGWTPSGPGGAPNQDKSYVAYLPVRPQEISLETRDAPPAEIALRIENPLPPGVAPTFEAGEQIFLSATVTRTSHVYCYYADAANNVLRLSPNKVNPHSQLAATQTLRLPDWLVPNPAFVMEASVAGTEQVSCFATTEDVMDRLPAPLQGPGVVNIPGYRSIADVEAAFRHALGSDALSRSDVTWRVIPKRTQPVTQQPVVDRNSPRT